jgi:DNA-binding winged helix-turn-helix (wHTH) protein
VLKLSFSLTKTFSKHMHPTDSFQTTSAYRFTIGDVTCDISQGTILRDDSLFQLEPRLCGVLALLVQRGRTIITRDEFLETIWDSEGSDEALTQAISRLRKILGDNALIETVPRIGYRLALAPQLAATNGKIRPLAKEKGALNWSYLHMIYIGTLLLVGATAFWLGTRNNFEQESQFDLEIEQGPDFEFHKIPEG